MSTFFALLVAASQIGLCCWYIFECLKLRAERKKIAARQKAFEAEMTRWFESESAIANGTVRQYIARCKDWAADPWDPRWDGGNIFADIDQKTEQKH